MGRSEGLEGCKHLVIPLAIHAWHHTKKVNLLAIDFTIVTLPSLLALMFHHHGTDCYWLLGEHFRMFFLLSLLVQKLYVTSCVDTQPSMPELNSLRNYSRSFRLKYHR